MSFKENLWNDVTILTLNAKAKLVQTQIDQIEIWANRKRKSRFKPKQRASSVSITDQCKI